MRADIVANITAVSVLMPDPALMWIPVFVSLLHESYSPEVEPYDLQAVSMCLCDFEFQKIDNAVVTTPPEGLVNIIHRLHINHTRRNTRHARAGLRHQQLLQHQRQF